MKAQQFWGSVRNIFLAILRGELMMRLHLDRYFPHIIWTFFLIWMLIWTGYRAEGTMSRVETSKKELSDMKIYHAQKTVQLVSIGRISTLEQLLEDLGSDVKMPEQPATRIQ